MTQKPPFRTLVVNTIGEPGCGKTTLSFWLCQALKHAGVVVEFVPEVVKYECFTPQGRQRVASGRFDHRYLAQQNRLIRSVMGHVEVLINDGAYEMFPFYARRRMTPDDFARFNARIHTLVQEQKTAPTFGGAIFVAPVRQHAYENHGRIENADEALSLRQDMLGYLNTEFGSTMLEVTTEDNRALLLKAIVDHVRALRAKKAHRHS